MNIILESVILTLVLAELINIGLKSWKAEKIVWNRLFMEGGMPSRHAALVSSLTLSIGLVEGFTSSLFFVALFLSLIVIRDAMGVRHNVDLVVSKLNTLIKKKEKLTVVSGHTPAQVFFGIVLGFTVVLLLYYL